MLVCRQTILKVFKTPLKKADDVFAYSLEVRKIAGRSSIPNSCKTVWTYQIQVYPWFEWFNMRRFCATPGPHTQSQAKPEDHDVEHGIVPQSTVKVLPLSKRITIQRTNQLQPHIEISRHQRIMICRQPNLFPHPFQTHILTYCHFIFLTHVFPKTCSTSKSSHLPILAPQNRPFLARWLRQGIHREATHRQLIRHKIQTVAYPQRLLRSHLLTLLAVPGWPRHTLVMML